MRYWCARARPRGRAILPDLGARWRRMVSDGVWKASLTDREAAEGTRMTDAMNCISRLSDEAVAAFSFTAEALVQQERSYRGV